MLRISIVAVLLFVPTALSAAAIISCTPGTANVAGNLNVTGSLDAGSISVLGKSLADIYQEDIKGVGEGDCPPGQYAYGIKNDGTIMCNPVGGGPGSFVRLQSTPPSSTDTGSFAVSDQGWVANLRLGALSDHTLSTAGGANLDLAGPNIGFNYSTGGSPEVRFYGGTTSTQAVVSPLGKIGAFRGGNPPDPNCPSSSGWDCGVRTWDVWSDASLRTNKICIGGGVGTANPGQCVNQWTDVASYIPQITANTCPGGQFATAIDTSGKLTCSAPPSTGVSSLNALTGAITIAGSNGITVSTPNPSTIALTGPGTGPFVTLFPGSPSLANTRQSGNFWISQGALANYTPASLSSTDVLQAKADPAGTATALYAEQNNASAWAGSFSGDILVRNPANNAELCLNGTSGAACRSSWPQEGVWPLGSYCVVRAVNSAGALQACPTGFTPSVLVVDGANQGNVKATPIASGPLPAASAAMDSSSNLQFCCKL